MITWILQNSFVIFIFNLDLLFYLERSLVSLIVNFFLILVMILLIH